MDDKGGKVMIIFSTKFYVKQELTMEKFIELAFDWINGSPHYGFNAICWNGEPLYEIETEKQKLSIVQSIDKKYWLYDWKIEMMTMLFGRMILFMRKET